MKLQQYKEYTIDYRMKQIRKCDGGWENGGFIDFIDFDSDKGDEILCEMIKDNVLDYSQYNV